MAKMLEKLKNQFDILHVSSGGLYEMEAYDIFPAYQLEYAAKIKELVDMQVIAVGRLENPKIAQQALIDGKTDMIAIGKGLLSDPHWPLHAAQILNIDIEWPLPYQRAKFI
jgi:NADPH2 dehydrogenase